MYSNPHCYTNFTTNHEMSWTREGSFTMKRPHQHRILCALSTSVMKIHLKKGMEQARLSLGGSGGILKWWEHLAYSGNNKTLCLSVQLRFFCIKTSGLHLVRKTVPQAQTRLNLLWTWLRFLTKKRIRHIKVDLIGTSQHDPQKNKIIVPAWIWETL